MESHTNSMVPVTTNQMRISQIGGTPIAGWFIMENPLIPICSMYGIFTYIWAIFGVNVGKYSIHGASGDNNSGTQFLEKPPMILSWHVALTQLDMMPAECQWEIHQVMLR
jgi:hypothetical protein